MQNTSGIFLVLGVGGILGLIVAIIDFMLDARQISVKERVSLYETLASARSFAYMVPEKSYSTVEKTVYSQRPN